MRKSFAIGCQLVAPSVLLQVVDPRIEVVLVPSWSNDHHFGAGKGNQSSFSPFSFEWDRASFFDGESPCLKVREQNLTLVACELEKSLLDLAGAEGFIGLERAVRLKHLHSFCYWRDGHDATFKFVEADFLILGDNFSSES